MYIYISNHSLDGGELPILAATLPPPVGVAWPPPVGRPAASPGKTSAKYSIKNVGFSRIIYSKNKSIELSILEILSVDIYIYIHNHLNLNIIE